MRILVTGSTGVIGQWVVRRLLEEGHQLRTLDLAAQPEHADVEHKPGDVRDSGLVRRAMQGMQAVVHLAAIPFDMDRQDEMILDTNIRGTWNVLLAAQEAGATRVVNFSSTNALGQAEPNRPGLYLPLDDEIPSYTVGNYPTSKHIGEDLCSAFARRGKLTCVSLRPTHVMHPGPSRFAWLRMLPEEFKLRAAIGDFFSYVDVRDVAEAAALSLTAKIDGHQAFLLTSDELRVRTPTLEIVNQYYSNLPWPRISRAEYLARGEYVSLVDCSAAKKALGWQPKYSLFDPGAGYEE